MSAKQSLIPPSVEPGGSSKRVTMEPSSNIYTLQKKAYKGLQNVISKHARSMSGFSYPTIREMREVFNDISNLKPVIENVISSNELRISRMQQDDPEANWDINGRREWIDLIHRGYNELNEVRDRINAQNSENPPDRISIRPFNEVIYNDVGIILRSIKSRFEYYLEKYCYLGPNEDGFWNEIEQNQELNDNVRFQVPPPHERDLGFGPPRPGFWDVDVGEGLFPELRNLGAGGFDVALPWAGRG